MNRLALLALLAACEDSRREGVNADLVPRRLQDLLAFETQTIQLQPDDVAPAWTMRAPAAWHVDRALTSGSSLVNGAGEVNQEYVAKTFYNASPSSDGLYMLGIGCPGACGHTLADELLASWHDPTIATRVLDEDVTRDDRRITFEGTDDDIFVVRLWWPAGDDRVRECAVHLSKKYAAAYKAFAKSCAEIVEQP